MFWRVKSHGRERRRHTTHPPTCTTSERFRVCARCCHSAAVSVTGLRVALLLLLLLPSDDDDDDDGRATRDGGARGARLVGVCAHHTAGGLPDANEGDGWCWGVLKLCWNVAEGTCAPRAAVPICAGAGRACKRSVVPAPAAAGPMPCSRLAPDRCMVAKVGLFGFSEARTDVAFAWLPALCVGHSLWALETANGTRLQGWTLGGAEAGPRRISECGVSASETRTLPLLNVNRASLLSQHRESYHARSYDKPTTATKTRGDDQDGPYDGLPHQIQAKNLLAKLPAVPSRSQQTPKGRNSGE